MVSAKRGMGPSGWAPRRTHAVGTVTSRAGGIPSRALISSALRSFLGRRRGWPNEEANTLWVPTDARRGPGTAKKNEENMRRNNDEENCTFGIDRQTALGSRSLMQVSSCVCLSFLLAESSYAISS